MNIMLPYLNLSVIVKLNKIIKDWTNTKKKNPSKVLSAFLLLISFQLASSLKTGDEGSFWNYWSLRFESISGTMWPRESQEFVLQVGKLRPTVGKEYIQENWGKVLGSSHQIGSSNSGGFIKTLRIMWIILWLQFFIWEMVHQYLKGFLQWP